jgi:uncharacterized membrane protein
MAGEKLAAHFPWKSGDVNELPDQISTSWNRYPTY